MSETTNPTHPCQFLAHQHTPNIIDDPRTLARVPVDLGQALAAKDPPSPTCKQMGDMASSPPSIQPESSHAPSDELATDADFANPAFQAFLARIIRRRGYAQHEVADIVQDTNEVLIEKTRLRLVRRKALPIFAFWTTFNCGNAHLRHWRGRLVLGGSHNGEDRWHAFLEQSLVAPSDPERDLQAAQGYALVWNTVEAMPVRMGRVAKACFFDELDCGEIPSAVGASCREVSRDLFKARRRCEEKLGLRLCSSTSTGRQVESKEAGRV
jgi:RNA polymerase sigma factor (sigma-70 family)